MKLWRRIVSVLAGTMIAAGGVIVAATVLQTGEPQGGTSAPPSPTLDLGESRVVVQSDAASAAAWVNATRGGGPPTPAEQAQAALAAHSLAEVSGVAAPPTASGNRTTSYSDSALSVSMDHTAYVARSDAAAIVGAQPSAPPAPNRSSTTTSVTLLVSSVNSGDPGGEKAVVDQLGANASRVLYTPLAEADAEAGGEPTDNLGLKATVGDPPASVANWSTAATNEIRARHAGGTLENDTLNLSFASQALRPSSPADADALNAELRFRQHADGSFGDIRSTSEAARALALGTFADRAAAVRALTWLDAQGTLSPQMATLRLRAHAYDGELALTGFAEPPTAADRAPAAAMGAPVVSPLGVGVFLMLFGGIGLSLSLVTTDALKGSRRTLYDTVRASPGLHVNELRRRLHMSPSSIEYHLSVLVGAGLVVAEDDGRYKRYYANGAGLGLNPRAPLSRNTLGALRRPHAVALVRALAERGGQPATARELARALALHESAVARRLAHLEDSGVLASERQGRARLYRLADPAAALKALSAVQEAPPVLATTGAPVVPLEPQAPPQVAQGPGASTGAGSPQ